MELTVIWEGSIRVQWTSRGDKTRLQTNSSDVKDNHRFIMMSFRHHVCLPPSKENVSPAVIQKRSFGIASGIDVIYLKDSFTSIIHIWRFYH